MDRLPAPDREDQTGGSATGGSLEFTCPRCRSAVSERFYGPCRSCRTALRAAHQGAARDIAAEAYVPKMNVTPNAVATKD